MPKTYNDLYIETRRAFREADISCYALEARLICAKAAGRRVEKFMQQLRFYASDDVERELDLLVARRLKGEPAAYITGSWEFYGLPFEVSPDVLSPRMDTEVLVDAAIENLRERRLGARVLDLCSGSGCIGCAVAHEMPSARVVMADLSRKALEIGRKNAELNNLTSRVTFVEADALRSPPMLIGSFDLVLCNPPYIPSGEIPGLDVSVRGFEPHSALDGGADGLDFYRAILRIWKCVIRTGGYIMFEVGEDQAESVMTLMRLAGFHGISTVRDTADIERVVIGHL